MLTEFCTEKTIEVPLILSDSVQNLICHLLTTRKLSSPQSLLMPIVKASKCPEFPSVKLKQIIDKNEFSLVLHSCKRF